jgi:uncharacterized metal-binding protein
MEGKKVVIYNCFGGFSNTGFTAALATIEALKEVGLDKACIACSVGLPANVKDVFENTDQAKKIITVDGCPFECARKVVESAGYKVTDSIQLARDIQMKKRSFFKGTGEVKNVMELIDEEDVKKAKDLIVKKILAD